jgi:Ring finger domain
MFLLRRHNARFQSERVASTENELPDGSGRQTTSSTMVSIPTVAADDQHDEEGAFMNSTTSSNSTLAIRDTTRVQADIARSFTTRASQPHIVAVEELEEGASESDEEDDSAGMNRHSMRHTISLAELEEERELARRRSSLCLLFALFVLFRLWILALQDGDFGLLLLCLVGSSWTARWVRYNRDQEEELDRRIANYLQNSDNGSGEVARDDLRMLSFQAQLALAIMESQRQMMQGGYGHPDADGQQTPGVSDEARSKWNKFTYKDSRDKKESRRGSYGSVAQGDVVKPSSVDDEPHCSICLGEYEDGEDLSKLPCGHIYHNECIGSWCSNHTRCPLCNTDLEAGGLESV